jgi:hypothetical protein
MLHTSVNAKMLVGTVENHEAYYSWQSVSRPKFKQIASRKQEH